VHVLGINSHWDKKAAELSARIWMRQMRFLYGFGKWESDDVEFACNQVFELVNESIRRLLVEVGLNEFGLTSKNGKNNSIVDTITRMVVGSHQGEGRKPLFNLDFASDYPIVAVGAPAASYYQNVADSMNIGLHLPEHADVANAFGAVMGSVIQRAQVTVTQPMHGIFCLFHDDQPQQFETIAAAKEKAQEIVSKLAQQKALDAGAINPTVTLEYDDIHVLDDIDGELFLESTVIATAIGPACDWRSDKAK
jgi:N-methylhydantoinase A/oxoprolinase/acetone carboxylase beta subunit